MFYMNISRTIIRVLVENLDINIKGISFAYNYDEHNPYTYTL